MPWHQPARIRAALSSLQPVRLATIVPASPHTFCRTLAHSHGNNDVSHGGRSHVEKHVNVGIIGLGAVGRELIRQIEEHKHAIEHRTAMQIRVGMVADSTGYAVGHHQGFSDEQLQDMLREKAKGKSLHDHWDKEHFFHAGPTKKNHHDMGPKKLWQKVTAAAPHGEWVLVDCSATEDTLPLLDHASKTGAGVVLANKKPLTASQAAFASLTAPGRLHRVRYESTVGAGTPMVATLERLRHSNDTVSCVQGTFSGTLGYLMSGLQEGRLSYSQLVKEAKDKGFTEPDPRDDLGGMDVARKALILARTLGWSLEMSDVKVEPLFPQEFASLSAEEFMARLPELDQEFADKTHEAKGEGKVLRHVATLQHGKCSVGLEAVDKDSPLGQLQGTTNMVAFHTKYFGDAPLVVQGAGAGAEVTATGCLADIVSAGFATL